MEKMALLTRLTSFTVRHRVCVHFTVSKRSPTSTRPSRRSNCTALESMGTNLQSTHFCTSPSFRLDSASRLGIQSPTILHRPSHNALHSPLPALQLAFPPLRRLSPRPPATSNTPEPPQSRALTWRPVHCGLLRASFNSAVHDATSTLAAVFGALASLPPDPAERGAMPCRTSFRTKASATSRVARCQANSVTGISSPSGKFRQHCTSASSRRVEGATKTDVWSSVPT